MSSFAVDLEGVSSLDAALAAVQDALQDPANAQRTAQLIKGNAHPPRDTGALDTSATVQASGTGATLVYAVPYSAIVQASQPWLGAAITASVDQLVELYAKDSLDAWSRH